MEAPPEAYNNPVWRFILKAVVATSLLLSDLYTVKSVASDSKL
jgi:hypothetical protein